MRYVGHPSDSAKHECKLYHGDLQLSKIVMIYKKDYDDFFFIKRRILHLHVIDAYKTNLLRFEKSNLLVLPKVTSKICTTFKDKLRHSCE